MTLQFVQDQFFDENEALFIGQLADYASSHLANRPSFVNETVVFAGRGVVKGTVFTAANHHKRTPHAVKAATGASVEADFSGIVMREYSQDADPSTGELSRRADSMVTLATTGNKTKIAVKANVNIADGDSVYMSIDAAQTPNLPVGEFTNAAAAGVIELTALKFYGAADAGTIARIEL